MAISRLKQTMGLSVQWTRDWWLTFALLVAMIGLRHEVGGDWYNDWELVTGVRQSGAIVLLSEAIVKTDIGYSLLIWLVNEIGLDVYTLDVLSAIPFVWGLIVFCRVQPRPWLALTVAVPYLVMVVAMGYTRQGVAIGFSMIGLVALSRGGIVRFACWLAFAALFHKSAVILLPLAVLADTRRTFFRILWVSIVTLILFALLLQESVDGLVRGYIVAQYESHGAGIRVAMNAVPAVLFLWFRRHFIMPERDSIFWTWISFGALAFVGLLAISPSSTAVDRVALYWIPLQLFVFSRLPNALGHRHGKNEFWVYAVVAYSATVHFVWLFFADTAFAWLPYQFYPWVWFWI